jgi:hypothetical protein
MKKILLACAFFLIAIIITSCIRTKKCECVEQWNLTHETGVFVVMADGCTLPGCVVKSYNNKPLPHFSVFKFQSKLLLLSMSQNPPGSTPFIPSHCLYPSQDNQNFRHNFGIKPVFHGKSSAYWHNCFFSKIIKKLVFCGRNAYFCSTISFLPCITGLARQERKGIEKLIDGGSIRN